MMENVREALGMFGRLCFGGRLLFLLFLDSVVIEKAITDAGAFGDVRLGL